MTGDQQTKKRGQDVQKAALAGALAASAFTPIFVRAGDGDGGGDGGGGCSGADAGASDAGGGAGGAGDADAGASGDACCDAGCGAGGGDAGGDAGDAGDSGCGCDGGWSPTLPATSTPFLSTWNGEKYVFENDFLFGKPSSLFTNRQTALTNYEAGKVTGDLYKIQNNLALKDGKLSFQIKEIEPEESYIDFLALQRVIYAKSDELIMDSKLQRYHIFNRKAVESNKGIAQQKITWNGKNVTNLLGDGQLVFANHAHEGHFIDRNKDVIEMSATVTDKNAPLFLIMRSFYRDWTLGEIFTDAKELQSVSLKDLFSHVRTPADFMKVGVLALVVSFLGTSSLFGSMFRSEAQSSTVNDAKELASLFSVKRASADIPVGRSIVSEYWDGQTFKPLDIISPRYYQRALDAIAVPAEAISPDGQVRLRITATHKHNVSYLGLVVPGVVSTTAKTELLQVRKAYHQREGKDYAATLNAKNSKEYLHTIPADIVDVEFDMPVETLDKTSQQESYLLAANGVYTSLSPESKLLAGDWVSKLEPESREWLKNMKALKV